MHAHIAQGFGRHAEVNYPCLAFTINISKSIEACESKPFLRQLGLQASVFALPASQLDLARARAHTSVYGADHSPETFCNTGWRLMLAASVPAAAEAQLQNL